MINTRQLEDAYTGVEQNTKFLVAASAANERSSASLAIMQVNVVYIYIYLYLYIYIYISIYISVCMQVVLAGGFAFDFLDRATGGTLNVDPPAWAIQLVFRIFIDPPLVFFVVNIVWLCTFCYALVRLI